MPDAPDFLEALYGDPLREETQRTGRHLIIVSAVCIAVVLFKVQFQQTSLLPLDFGKHNEVLAMLLSLAVLLLLASFVLRATTDLLRDREAGLLVSRYITDKQLEASQAAAQEVDEQIASQKHEDEYGPSEGDPWWEGYYEVKQASEAAIKEAEDRIGLRRLPRSVRSARKGLEIAVPVLIALLALFLSRYALYDFFAALFAALTP